MAGAESPRKGSYAPKHAPKSQAKGSARRSSAGPSRPAPKRQRKSFFRRRWVLILLLTPLLVGLSGLAALTFAYARIELPQTLPPVQTTYLYDRNGELITTLHGAVDRTVVSLEEISPNMIDAVIATEDHGFYDHAGIDPRGIGRAVYINLLKRDTVQGASTLTEQLVKNVYAGTYETDENGIQRYVVPERTVKEKVREILLAVKLETELGKDQILETYLNTVYFGHGAYGVEAAAQTYFGKPAARLTILESASLAGVLHAPELYDPIDRPYDNRFRRDYSLDQMVRYGYLESRVAEKLKKKDCCGTIPDAGQERIEAPGDAEYFVDYTRRLLFERYGEALVYGGGLKVTTTLDLNLQRAAEEAIETNLPHPKDNPAAALVAMDPATGDILAMAGGRDWSKNKVNYATGQGGSGRGAGSAFKAFTLAAAMEQNYDLEAYWSGPSSMPIPGCSDPTQPDGIWRPVNAGDSTSGTLSLADATAHSVNTVYAQLIDHLEPQSVVDMAHALGIRSDIPPVCAITLGSVSVNPLEMTNAYATLADQGERHWASPLLRVTYADGTIDDNIGSPGQQVVEPNDANLVTAALQGVVTDGTGGAAAIPPFPVAGKTGTGDENKDAWFCGYTMQIVTCVWMGWPQGAIPMENVEGVPAVYGGTLPAAIWHDFMFVAMQGQTALPFPTPFVDELHTVGPPVPVWSPSPSLAPCPSDAPTTTSPTPCITPSPEPREDHRPGRSPSEEPTPSPSEEPSPTPTGSPDPTPTETPSPTKSPKPLVTP